MGCQKLVNRFLTVTKLGGLFTQTLSTEFIRAHEFRINFIDESNVKARIFKAKIQKPSAREKRKNSMFVHKVVRVNVVVSFSTARNQWGVHFSKTELILII